MSPAGVCDVIPGMSVPSSIVNDALGNVWFTEANAKSGSDDSLAVKARAAESAIESAGARASRMTPQKYALAKERYREGLTLLNEFDSPTYTAWCMEGYATALNAEKFAEHLSAFGSKLNVEQTTEPKKSCK